MIPSIAHSFFKAPSRVRRQWERIPLIDRWLAAELIGPLLFGIAAFTAVSLSVGVVFELVRKVAETGLSPLVAMQVLALRLPGFLVLSFPMATLMATLLAFSRLSSSSELTALRSIGVPTWRMVAPAMIVAALMTVLTFTFNDLIVPSANLTAADRLDAALGRSLAAERGDNVVYSRYAEITSQDEKGNLIKSNDLAQLFYARRFRDGRMYEVTLVDFTKSGHQQLLTAKTGVWNEIRGMWDFHEGRIVDIDYNTNRTISANFNIYSYPFTKAPLDVGKLPSDAAQMSVAQALRAEALLEQSGDRKEARRLRVRIQEKLSFPAICLVFGLIGSTLGVRPNTRTSRSQGFGISVLLIFGYYLMSFVFSSLGIKGTLSPFFAAWLPVAIGLGSGLLLLRQASR